MEGCTLINIILIVTIIIFAIIMFVLRKRKLDNFTEVSIIFEKKEKVIDIINSNKINYFALLNKCGGANLKARNIKSNNSIITYTNSILDFTDEETNFISDIIRTHLAKIKNNGLSINYTNNWKFVKTEGIENEFPHTHLEYIFLPNDLIYSNKDYLIRTLFHEYCHVLQRRHFDKFVDLYENHWPFYLADSVKGSEYLVCKTRLNPDTENLNFLFIDDSDNYFYMATLFNESPTSLSDVVNYLIPVEKKDDNTFEITNLNNKILMNSYKPYIDIVGIKSNNYNVNEISAEYFAIMKMNAYDNKNKKVNTSLYNAFTKWYRDNF